MGLIKGTVRLENNYEKFMEEYECEKEYLLKIFKNENIVIEHIGSTSVKGLKAKPIIDIAIGIDKFKDFRYYESLFDNNYEVRNSLDIDEILIVKGSKDYTSVLIHLMEVQSTRYKESILFRDILRNNKKVLEEYQSLKEELAEKYSNDRSMYTKSKNDFIKAIVKRGIKEDKMFEKLELKDISNVDYLKYYNTIKENMEKEEWLGDFDNDKLSDVLENGGKLFNYFDGDKLACSMMYMNTSDKAKNKFGLEHDSELYAGCGPIMVSPEYIGNGLQLKMLNELEKHAKSFGKKYIITTVFPGNHYSIDNFVKNGYEFKNKFTFSRGDRNLYIKEI